VRAEEDHKRIRLISNSGFTVSSKLPEIYRKGRLIHIAAFGDDPRTSFWTAMLLLPVLSLSLANLVDPSEQKNPVGRLQANSRQHQPPPLILSVHIQFLEDNSPHHLTMVVN
jgi:hypothetical protein